MSTLFSFVTVRNPRTPTERELETGFVRYDPAIGAALVARFAQIWAGGAGPEAIRAAIDAFRETDLALATESALAEGFPRLTEWARWLARRAGKLTWPEVDAWRSAHPLDVGADQLAVLWDNLLAYTYGGGRPEVRELLVWALRAVHLTAFTDERRDDVSAVRVGEATVLVPAESHGQLARTASAEEPPDEPTDDRAVRIRERLDRLERLHRALTDRLAEATTLGRDEEVPPPAVPSVRPDGCVDSPTAPEATPSRPPAARVDDATLGGLPKELRAELSELGIEPGARLASVLRRLESEATSVGAEHWQYAEPTRSVVQVGGGFWTRAQRQASAPAAATPARTTATARARVDVRGDQEYSGFFGTHLEGPLASAECQVRPLGLGDFRRVEQRLCCYEPGEIAHVENVLEGETKERTTRHLTSTERTFTAVSEEETSTERDSQTADRLELERETTKVIEFELSFELGVSLAAQYGPVKITADTKFATSVSSQESDRQASRYAREVTDRALERVVRRVREERSTRTVEEFEEQNLHRLSAKDKHVVGIYRWINKIYEAKVVNYGKRLMFEFLVPEPAAFHLYAAVSDPVEGKVRLKKPIDPRSAETVAAFGRQPLTSHASITEANYGLWAAAYGALVEPPPSFLTTIAKAYHREGMDQTVQFADSKNDLRVPEGREASTFSSVFGLHSQFQDGGRNWITVMIGRRSRFAEQGTSFAGLLDGEDETVPVNVMGRTKFYAINIEIDCRRTDALFARWQLKTFDAILRAYADQQSAYDTALAAAAQEAGVAIRGSNPLRNREIEATELKKSCIRLLTRCADLSSDAMHDDGPCGYPEFDCCEAISDGSVVQFFEQLFEWQIMTYTFYPYFWGRRCNWEAIYQLDDVDPIFLKFLQAGYARVVVPIRPGYEKAALRYLADGALWGGGATPGLDSPMYVAIENELKEPVGKVDPDIEPWPIEVPTSLTVLQCGSGCVPGEGLPCPCKDEPKDTPEDGDDSDGDDSDGDDSDGASADPDHPAAPTARPAARRPARSRRSGPGGATTG